MSTCDFKIGLYSQASKLKLQNRWLNTFQDEASSADESDGESVDLSWLPDPDKIYGNDGDNNEKPLSEKSSEDSSEDEK